MRFVLDASVTLRWCLTHQQSASSIAVLEQMPTAEVYVPAIWPVEVASVLSREVNKRTITVDDALAFFQTLSAFDITVADANTDPSSIFKASRKHRLTGFDASYAELAIALELPLASDDNDMREAAQRAGVALVV
jgi:predicted nucleic acid-binding protein